MYVYWINMNIIPIKEIHSDFNQVQIHQGIDHIKERIYIHLDLTTVCNYECSYCCNRASFKNWQKPGSFNTIMQFFEELEEVKNKYDIPIFLMFTGGEPTYAIKYFDIMERARELLTHKDDRLILESNGSRPIEFYERYPFLEIGDEKVYHMFSIHPEYENRETVEAYSRKLNVLTKRGYKVKVNLMMMHSEKYYDFLEHAYGHLKAYGVEVHPHYIYHKDDHNPIKYPKKFWERFGTLMKSAKPTYDQDGEHYTDDQIFKENRNNFKGWTCYHNNITVSLDGSISNQCFDIDKIEDVFELMKGEKCPHNSCNCDGLLKIRKERN